MALEKLAILNQVVVHADGSITVKESFHFYEDGEKVGEAPEHWKVIEPGVDYDNEQPRVRNICGLIQTPTVIGEFKAAKAAKEDESNGIQGNG